MHQRTVSSLEKKVSPETYVDVLTHHCLLGYIYFGLFYCRAAVSHSIVPTRGWGGHFVSDRGGAIDQPHMNSESVLLALRIEFHMVVRCELFISEAEFSKSGSFDPIYPHPSKTMLVNRQRAPTPPSSAAHKTAGPARI